MPEPTRRNRGRVTRRQVVVAGAVIGGAALSPADALLLRTSRVFASVSQAQTPLPSANITKYVTALRTFNGHRVESSSFTSKMVEFQQVVLPPSMYPSGFKNGTWLWGYQSDGQPASWPGATVEVKRGTPTNITYVNNLPMAANRSHLEPLLTIDQTLHWADPLNAGTSFKPYA